MIAQLSLTGIAAGHGGSFTSLALPATAARQLLVPALLALFFTHVRRPSHGLLLSTAAAAGGLALVHPTYALFVGVPLVGFALARALLVRGELAPVLTGLAALAVPTALALAWLRPVVEATTVHNPSGEEVRRAFAQYPGQLAGTTNRYHVAERLFTRSGAVAIAGLVCVPLALFAEQIDPLAAHRSDRRARINGHERRDGHGWRLPELWCGAAPRRPWRPRREL